MAEIPFEIIAGAQHPGASMIDTSWRGALADPDLQEGGG